VWLVWRSFHSNQPPAALLVLVEHNPIFASKGLLPLREWINIGLLLNRNAVWCQNRYFELQKAKFTGTAVGSCSYQLLTTGSTATIPTETGSGAKTSSVGKSSTSNSTIPTTGRTEPSSNKPQFPTAKGASKSTTTARKIVTTVPMIPATSSYLTTYLYKGKYLQQSDYPWSDTHTPSSTLFQSDELNRQHDVNRWQQARLRVSHAQIVCRRQAVEQQNAELRGFIESFYTQAMPSIRSTFDTRSRSEVSNIESPFMSHV